MHIKCESITNAAGASSIFGIRANKSDLFKSYQLNIEAYNVCLNAIRLNFIGLK